MPRVLRVRYVLFWQSITLIMSIYFTMIIFIMKNIQVSHMDNEADKSSSVNSLDNPPPAGLESPLETPSVSSSGLVNSYQINILTLTPTNISLMIAVALRLQENAVPNSEPVTEPTKNPRNENGNFISLGESVFAYSAFIDDRKDSTWIRVTTLMPLSASHRNIFCQFKEVSKTQECQIYELCENHLMFFGGFFFSCPVPAVVNIKDLKSFEVSLNESGSKVTIPLLTIRPPKHRLAYLDVYPESLNTTSSGLLKTSPSTSLLPRSVARSNYLHKTAPTEPPLQTSVSFAICVSPLFGNISQHRLVEFVELSRLLGAQHFYFYQHSVTSEIYDVLRYYMGKKLATVLPWTLPSAVTSVWYHGQLLANNDCLYRSMQHFDLVSFNDIDEFIVPHTNSRTWGEAFSSLLTEDRSGFLFQSTLFKPDNTNPFRKSLITPVQTARSSGFSEFLTKVILSPWRVFEVGIHHISKQNREVWLPWRVKPEVAYIHHYRDCSNFWPSECVYSIKDTIIADRYLPDLLLNYELALKHIAIHSD